MINFGEFLKKNNYFELNEAIAYRKKDQPTVNVSRKNADYMVWINANNRNNDKGTEYCYAELINGKKVESSVKRDLTKKQYEELLGLRTKGIDKNEPADMYGSFSDDIDWSKYNLVPGAKEFIEKTKKMDVEERTKEMGELSAKLLKLDNVANVKGFCKDVQCLITMRSVAKHGLSPKEYNKIASLLKSIGVTEDFANITKNKPTVIYNICSDILNSIKAKEEKDFEEETARKTEEERSNRTNRMVKLSMGGKLHYNDQLMLDGTPFMESYAKYFNEVKEYAKANVLPEHDKFIMHKAGGVNQKFELSEAYKNMNLAVKFLKDLDKVSSKEEVTEFAKKFEKSGLMLDSKFDEKSLDDKKKELGEKLSSYYAEMMMKAWTVHRRNSSVYQGGTRLLKKPSIKYKEEAKKYELADSRWASDDPKDLFDFIKAVSKDVTPTAVFGKRPARACEVFGPGQMENMVRMFVVASRKLSNMDEKELNKLNTTQEKLQNQINETFKTIYGMDISIDDFEDVPMTNNSEVDLNKIVLKANKK